MTARSIAALIARSAVLVPKMAARDFTPSFALTTARNDVRLMQGVHGDNPTAILDGLARRMDQLLAEGHGDLDVGVLAR